MSDNLSQDDIDRLLSGNYSSPEQSGSPHELEYLTEVEADALGEIGNISMGSAATTLSMLLGQKVDITTPTVREFARIEDLFNEPKDTVTVEIGYKTGLDGVSIFGLAPSDTAIIADLMMGGDGKVSNIDIGELQLSAVGEAMNQMIGTASTSMSSMFNLNIDITPPTVKHQKAGQKPDLCKEVFGVPIVAVAFQLLIGDLVDSEIMQLMSLSSAQNLVSRLMGMANTVDEITATVQAPPSPPQQAHEQVISSSQPNSNSMDSLNTSQFMSSPGNDFAPPPPSNVPFGAPQNPVTVQPVQFTSFDDAAPMYGELNKNLDLVMDVKLRLTVELGRTELPIKKVLELTRGSVIELDKIAGEPVELFANGKLIAKGEVVVIEDNFGLRITSILSPDTRLKAV